jgi:hypothetical protein
VEWTVERLRRLSYARTFDDLKHRLVGSECIEINRFSLPASCAAAEADKIRAQGKLISLEKAERLGGGIARAYIVD